jgi:hypothetical protein
MNRVNRIALFVMVLVFISTVISCKASKPYGAKITITNVGEVPLDSVVVHVTGNSYELGTIAVNETRAVEAYPTGESDAKIEYIDTTGNKQNLPVNCYFEPGYKSLIKVEVTPNAATVTKNKIFG